MKLKILERNSEGKITKFNWDGTDFTPDKPIEEIAFTSFSSRT